MSPKSLTKEENAARKKIRRYICARNILARQRRNAIFTLIMTFIILCFATGLVDKLIGSENMLSPAQIVLRYIIFVPIAVLLGLNAFINIRSNHVMRRNTKRSLESLRQRNELEKAAAELETDNNTVFGMGSSLMSRVTKVETIASENYLFAKKHGAVIRYDDIVRYSVTKAKALAAITSYLKVYSSDENAPLFFYICTAKRSQKDTDNSNALIEQILSILSLRNPSATFEEEKNDKNAYIIRK